MTFNQINKKLLAVLLIAVVGISFSFMESKYFQIAKNLDLYSNLYQELHESYVDDIESAELMKEGINAMLKTLDPYTNYITESQIQAARLRQLGNPGDIGIKLVKRDKKFIVEEILQGLPAAEAGIQPGDIINKLDGQEVKGLSLEDVQAYLVGENGSDITLHMTKGVSGEEDVQVLLREVVKPESVTYHTMLNEDVGYVKLTRFTRACAAFLKGSIEELKEQGAKKLVLDLRANPGGLMNESIRICNLFVDQGELILSNEGNNPEWNREFLGQEAPLDKDIPLVVLINGKSASASEIVSGAMQDFDRGVVMGETSFGKGLVQNVKELELDFLPKGANRPRLKITVARYLLPSGRCIQSKDYSGKYADGVREIPDSVRQEFKTKNGRTVYDAGGVNPDIEVKADNYSSYTKYLKDEYHLFDYANYYRTKYDSIVAPEEFEITDQDYQDFISYLDKKEITFESQTLALLETLKESAESEKYYDAIQTDLKDLETKITSKNASYATKHKDEIIPQLKAEIANRYYYSQGEARASLESDILITNAIDLLNDSERYNSILAGQ